MPGMNDAGLQALIEALVKGGQPQGNIANLPAILAGLGQNPLGAGAGGLSAPLAELMTPFSPARGAIPNPTLPQSVAQQRPQLGI